MGFALLCIVCFSLNMAFISRSTENFKYLTSEDIIEMVEKARTSTDALSDYDSSAGSTISSVWESSEPDNSDTAYEDKSTDFSGSCSPTEPRTPLDHCSDDEEEHVSQECVALEQEKTNDSPVIPTQRYNLRSSTKRKAENIDLPPPKRPCHYRSKHKTLKSTQKRNGRGGQDGDGDGNHSRGRVAGSRDRGGSGSGGRDNAGSSGRHGKGHGKHGERNGSVEDRDSPVGKQKGKAKKLDPLDKLPHSAISIKMKELVNIKHADFCPLREPGIYIPDDMDVSALSLFELFFDDVVLKCLLDSTLEYAELKKAEKCKRYHLFMRQKLTTAELKAYLGALLLLGIHSVRNHRKAWSTATAQVLIRLRDLLTCQRFELIGMFLHVVTKQEEEEAKEDRLRKLLPLINYIKSKCFEFYQPVQQLAVDERMVKSKARSHLIQFMRNKPVKWGFKLWVIADPSGYTLDFNVYTGKDTNGKSDHGLAYDVVMKLVAPFLFQGYHLYIDNFYTSRKLLDELYQCEMYTTGTFRIDRKDVPSDVKLMKEVLNGRKISRGSGYYYRPAIQALTSQSSSDVESSSYYLRWRGNC